MTSEDLVINKQSSWLI